MSVGPPGGGSVTGTSVIGYGLGSSIGWGGSGTVGPVGSSGIGKSGLSFGSSDGVGGRFCIVVYLAGRVPRLVSLHCRRAYTVLKCLFGHGRTRCELLTSGMLSTTIDA
jgi:hypothetical protein